MTEGCPLVIEDGCVVERGKARPGVKGGDFYLTGCSSGRDGT